MASLFVYRNKLHIEYNKAGHKVRENLALIPNERNWELGRSKRKEIEALYETKNENSLLRKLILKELETSELTLYSAIEKYQNHLSNSSIEHQNMFINAMNKFSKVVEPERRIDKIRSSDITSYLRLLKATVSNATQRTNYTYIKMFFTYLFKEDILDKSPCRNVPGPREIEKEIIVFSDDLLLKILEETKHLDYKLYILFVFLSLTGMRVIDALNLTSDNFVMKESYIKLNVSKTKLFRTFPIYEELRIFIEEEMKPLLSLTKNQKLFEGFTRGSIGQRFRRMKKRFDIPNNYTITLKTFRKTLATRMLNAGVRVEFVSKLLHHKKLATTMKYYALPEIVSIQAEIENSSIQILPKMIQE
ncbi:MAG: site-specific integrase [Bacteroidetes bacterium]|nr:site-specific integrase [Bacteroidota bacterium]